jgi:hypothetical protein
MVELQKYFNAIQKDPMGAGKAFAGKITVYDIVNGNRVYKTLPNIYKPL